MIISSNRIIEFMIKKQCKAAGLDKEQTKELAKWIEENQVELMQNKELIIDKLKEIKERGKT